MNLTNLENFDPEAGEMRSHYSALTLHRKCAQAWYYRYGMKLTRDTTQISPERDLGIWWSAIRAAESLERGRELDSIIATPRKLEGISGYEFDPTEVTVTEVLKGISDWWSKQPADVVEAWEERLGTSNALIHSIDMFDRWYDFSEEDRKYEKPLGVEVFWKRQLPRPESDAQWSLANLDEIPKLNLIGYVDELYIDTQRSDMVVVRDHKTSKTLDTGIAADDQMDPQLPLYVWGVMPLLKRHGYKPPRAVSYDRARSKSPATPQLTATGALSKSVTDYDIQTYLRWARTDTRPGVEEMTEISHRLTGEVMSKVEEILSEPGQFWGKLGEFFVSGAKKGQPKFGVHEIDEKMVEHLESHSVVEKWNSRTLDPVNSNVVRSHLRSAVDTATDIWQTQMRAKANGSAARSYSRAACSWCDFQSLCVAQMIGGPRGEYDLAEHGLKVQEKR